MNKRNDTRRETLLDVGDQAIMSLDALVEQCHRALSAQLWMTCCWSDGGSGWKIGDYRYLVVSVEPDEDTSLYVQFWSEPRERAWMEIGSGESCPGAIRYVGAAQRHALEARGYARCGRAGNHEKELVVDSASSAEAAAREVLQIFFEVFGYRGQWRLNLKRHRGERADHCPVYTSVTPEDFEKVAAGAGYQATVTNSGDTPVVALTRGRREFQAVMEWRVAKQNLYSLVALQADLTLPQPPADEAISGINSRFQLVKVWRTDRRTVRMRMPLVLDGGVTAAWLAQSLHHWISSWRECERQLRRAAVPAKHRRTSHQHVELIH
jgi:hypothetical protein